MMLARARRYRKVVAGRSGRFPQLGGAGPRGPRKEMKIVGIGQNAVPGAARSRWTMEQARPSNCVIRSVR